MKFVIMVAASAASAGLVLPTVSQGESKSVYEQATNAVNYLKAPERQA